VLLGEIGATDFNRGESKMATQVYISGALTGVSNPDALKAFYEAIAKVCEGVNMVPYVPHLVSDPVQNPGMTPREVYELDRDKVAHSDLVIAYVGAPSLGVGSEIEIARENSVPVILLMENTARVSRMIRGNPAVIAELKFSGYDNGLRQLSDLLSKQNLS
jgi:hypothetical protein